MVIYRLLLKEKSFFTHRTQFQYLKLPEMFLGNLRINTVKSFLIKTYVLNKEKKEIPASYFQKEAQHMVSVQGTSGMLQESLKRFQHGLLDPDEESPFKEKNNHKILIFLLLLYL